MTEGGSLLLPGRYKSCFTADAHRRVHDWYYGPETNAAQRHAFKALIKQVLAFDFARASSDKLRATYSSDIPGASAIVQLNGGSLMTPDFAERATLFLSFAGPAVRQQFRETFGLITPPRTFGGEGVCSETKLDFQPLRRAPSASLGVLAASRGDEGKVRRGRSVLGADHIKPHSVPTTAPCEVIAAVRTVTGSMYPWKVQGRSGVNVLQRAHEASQKGAPWGPAGGAAVNPTQWLSHTHEALAGHEYRFDVPELLHSLESSADTAQARASEAALLHSGKYRSGPGVSIGKRRYQNYNDNYCGALLTLDQQRRKGNVSLPSLDDVERSRMQRTLPAVAPLYAKSVSPAPTT
jgi:hypothetical protein